MGEEIEYFCYEKAARGKQLEDIDILVGCPIQKREWIFSDWHWAVMTSCHAAGLNPGFIFVIDPNEEPLNTIIHNLAKINNNRLWIVPVEEKAREDIRDWNEQRYKRMVELRNLLLKHVRTISPPLFLSLDSDIILHPDTVTSMMANLTEEYAAIGGKAYMTHIGQYHPSYGRLSNHGNLQRPDSQGVFKVDVIMAIKLMKPEAYNIDYKFDSMGEDIGFSKNCKEAGLRLCWDGTIANKHVMRKEDIDRIDPRVGY